MDQVLCPKCGSHMVIKQAMRGQNAGGEFYGCSTFPKCRGTLPIDNSSNKSQDHNEEKYNLSNNFVPIPRGFKARSKYKNYQAKFFDTIAVPDQYLKRRNEDDTFDKYLQLNSKWRIDYPIINNQILSDDMSNCLAVLEKILQRGHVTRLSSALEHNILNRECSGVDLFGVVSEKGNKNIWHDGFGAELTFYHDILPNILGPNYRNYVIPQVYISTLVKRNLQSTDEQRVDFLINLPNKKIIVELDGGEHDEHEQKDNHRNNILESEGYIIHRIPNHEIDKGHGTHLEAFNNDILLYFNLTENPLKSLSISDSIIKFLHQIQICILEAIYSGIVDITKKVYIHIDNSNINLNIEDLMFFLNETIKDFCELGNNILTLFNQYTTSFDIQLIDNTRDHYENCFCISFNEGSVLNHPTFYVQNIYWDRPIVFSSRSYSPINLENVEIDNLIFFLNYIFKKDEFREGQFEAISKALTGNDAIVLLPTGHGKSIAFQLASLLLPGVSVVIDPIISLIDDQIENLRIAGIDRCVGITSQISNRDDIEEIVDLFAKGEYLFCYIAPERFQTKRFREALRTLTVSIPICLIAVDEAHCVSEWGHDFRTSYLNIGRISREFCSSKGFVPPLLALTGTASRVVLKDVIRVLQIEDFEAIITPTTFDRKELTFEIIHSSSKEKFQILQGVMNNLLPNKFRLSTQSFYQDLGDITYSGLVFCPHVNGEYGVFNLSQNIQSKITRSVDFYSGTNPKFFKGQNYNIKKKETAHRFKNNKVQILVATKAFGMGIDKPNIRFTVHYGIPGSIEAFYQEAGRAGRDRGDSHCIIIYSNDDYKHNDILLDPNNSYEKINSFMAEVDIRDDISRSLFFHTNAFKGISEELKNVEIVIDHIPDITKRSEHNIIVEGKERNDIEKGLHRLLTLGVVIDYTIDYSSNEFTVYTSGIEYKGIIEAYADYVSGYHRGRMNEEIRKAEAIKHLPFKIFVIEMAKLLITFIYDVIEKSRRRSLSEMSLLCSDSKNNVQIKERILRYLQTEYSESIELLLEEEESGLEQMKNIIESVRSMKDAASIRGEVSRYLVSYPDHPGLLFLRGIIELFTEEKNRTVAEQNVTAAITNGLNAYGLTPVKLYESIGWALSVLLERDQTFVTNLLKDLLIKIDDNDFSRQLMLYLPSHLNNQVAMKMLNSVSNNILKLF